VPELEPVSGLVLVPVLEPGLVLELGLVSEPVLVPEPGLGLALVQHMLSMKRQE
jgi:hypothetical protein